MARKMACIRRITDIKPIPDADRIETAYVGGWPVVIGKDEFKINQKVVYFEPDSMLPLSNPLFAPLATRGKNRMNDKDELCVVLRTVKLRKQISQGLILRLSDFNINEDTDVDTDVTELTGVQKYDPPEVANRPKNLKVWPNGLITKTDEDRIQNKIDMLKWFADTENSERIASMFKPSEKLDGTSTTFFKMKTNDVINHPDGWRYGVCSRNNEVLRSSNAPDYAIHDGMPARITDATENLYWLMFDKYDMKTRLNELLQKYPDAIVIAIQGETTGPSVNGNRLNRKVLEFHAFNVLIDGHRINPTDEPAVSDIVVPQRPEFNLDFHYGMNPQEEMEAIIDRIDGLHSSIDKNRLAEGIVYRLDVNSDELPDGFNPEWKHWKVISNKYLLKIK